jgi:hypothetical protein
MNEIKKRAGRPLKTPEELRTHDLRIPVNELEKEIITEAVYASGADNLASWCRNVLLNAAQGIL